MENHSYLGFVFRIFSSKTAMQIFSQSITKDTAVENQVYQGNRILIIKKRNQRRSAIDVFALFSWQLTSISTTNMGEDSSLSWQNQHFFLFTFFASYYYNPQDDDDNNHIYDFY